VTGDLGRKVGRGEVLADDSGVAPAILVKKNAVGGLDPVDAKIGCGIRRAYLRQDVESKVAVDRVARREMAEVDHEFPFA
jgi:hypothetical protein